MSDISFSGRRFFTLGMAGAVLIASFGPPAPAAFANVITLPGNAGNAPLAGLGGQVSYVAAGIVGQAGANLGLGSPQLAGVGLGPTIHDVGAPRVQLNEHGPLAGQAAQMGHPGGMDGAAIAINPVPPTIAAAISDNSPAIGGAAGAVRNPSGATRDADADAVGLQALAAVAPIAHIAPPAADGTRVGRNAAVAEKNDAWTIAFDGAAQRGGFLDTVTAEQGFGAIVPDARGAGTQATVFPAGTPEAVRENRAVATLTSGGGLADVAGAGVGFFDNSRVRPRSEVAAAVAPQPTPHGADTAGAGRGREGRDSSPSADVSDGLHQAAIDPAMDRLNQSGRDGAPSRAKGFMHAHGATRSILRRAAVITAILGGSMFGTIAAVAATSGLFGFPAIDLWTVGQIMARVGAVATGLSLTAAAVTDLAVKSDAAKFPAMFVIVCLLLAPSLLALFGGGILLGAYCLLAFLP